MRHGPITVEYTPPGGPRRRITYESGAGEWVRRVEVYRGGRWRPAGEEPVADVVASMPAADVEVGP